VLLYKDIRAVAMEVGIS